jgi:uncharacterized protein with NAD-binding domain and iron-sulfur cluster
MTASGKQRIAVLGGGIGALAAVFKLTQQPNWQDRFDITVYQLGWRLGGKGASGRNAQYNNRIEEHGLHVWAGFYENAFQLMNAVYRDYAPPASPIKSIQDAFVKENHICLAEYHKGQWLDWHMYFEPNDQWPGEGPTTQPTLLKYLVLVLERLKNIHVQLPPELRARMPVPALDIPSDIAKVMPAGQAVPATTGDALLHFAHTIAVEAQEAARDLADVAVSVGWFLRRYQRDFIAQLATAIDWDDTIIRRAVISLDLLRCIAATMVCDGVLTGGFSAIDQYDLVEVLKRHNPLDQTITSTLLVSGYDYTFAYENGDRSKPRLSAASAFEAFFRLLFTYKGALFFKMVAGAGDIIFAPIYEVLKAKGVDFQFFHRVEELIPKDGHIEQIRISVQAKPNAPTYEPLVPVNGLQCWPSAPRYELLVNGQDLQEKQIDLENDQTYAIGKKILTYGTDFDAIILGIPPGALIRICARLPGQSQAWGEMLANIATVSTQALQLWIDCPMADFGGPFVVPYPPPDLVGPTCTSFEPPFDTWADMSHLLRQESWGAGGPRNVAYFCAVMTDPAPVPDRDPQSVANAQVRANAVAWLNQSIRGLWPNAVDAQGFRWQMLHAAAGKVGADRLDDQYWRANIAGSERYVLSLPGTLKYRLRSRPTDFANLYLAGDWVRVAAINSGCMEVAVMGGLGAAAALAGIDDGVVA